MPRIGHSLPAAVALLAAVLALAAGRADGAPSALRLVKVASGLDTPVLATAPAGEAKRLYVVEQGGLIRVLESGALRARPFLDLRSKVQAGGEQGLLGLAFAPDYATSRTFVVNYTDRNGDTRIVRYRSDGTKGLPGSAKQLLLVKQPYANHNGGMVAYGPDGLLYVGMGDGGSGGDPENRAQSMSTLLGKIVRLDARKPAAQPVIVAAGVRNPWRFSFDRKNGDLYVGDVGQGAIEEVDWVAWPWRGLAQLRLGRLRGPREVRGQGARARQARAAGGPVHATTTAARSRAATSTAARRSRPRRAATSTATTAAAPSGR